MLLLNNDCILYKVESQSALNILPKHKPSPFERLESKRVYDKVIQINYSWVDPIKIKDKIVGREQHDVMIWFLEEHEVLCFFSNSESRISFAINSFIKQFQVRLIKIEIYNVWQEIFLKGKKLFADLVSISIFSESIVSDKSEIRNIPIKDLDYSKIRELLRDKVACLNLKCRDKNIYFDLDSASVISFYDTVDSEEVWHVLDSLILQVS